MLVDGWMKRCAIVNSINFALTFIAAVMGLFAIVHGFAFPSTKRYSISRRWQIEMTFVSGDDSHCISRWSMLCDVRRCIPVHHFIVNPVTPSLTVASVRKHLLSQTKLLSFTNDWIALPFSAFLFFASTLSDTTKLLSMLQSCSSMALPDVFCIILLTGLLYCH